MGPPLPAEKPLFLEERVQAPKRRHLQVVRKEDSQQGEVLTQRIDCSHYDPNVVDPNLIFPLYRLPDYFEESRMPHMAGWDMTVYLNGSYKTQD